MTRYCIQADWSDAPHLTEDQKKKLWESIPPYQRDARTKGIPQLGSGAIYPVAESDVVVAPFDIPVWWPKAYGLDVGWNRTAAVWAAIDRETDVVYVYSEHYRGQVEPVVHAEAIKARGSWMVGAIDPASRGRQQGDGQQLLDLYRKAGLHLVEADNGVESGIYEVWQRLSSGRLKFFSTCTNLLAEFRIYRRDDKGKVVKENDHALDALRYLTVTGLKNARPDPEQHRKYAEQQGLTMLRAGVRTEWNPYDGY